MVAVITKRPKIIPIYTGLDLTFQQLHLIPYKHLNTQYVLKNALLRIPQNLYCAKSLVSSMALMLKILKTANTTLQL